MSIEMHGVRRRLSAALTAGALVTVGLVAPSSVASVGADVGETATGSSVSGTTVAGLRSTSQTGTSAVVNWRLVSSADSYAVYVDDRPAIIDTDGWLSIRFLRPLETYSVTVAAVVDGVEGERSDPVLVTTTDIVLRDPRLHVDFGVYRLSSSLVPFAWDVLPATSIELYRDGVLLDPATLGNVSQRLLDRDVEPGATYVYQARLVSDATGKVGEFGPEVTVTVPGRVLGSAPSLTATFADRQVVVLRIDELPVARWYEIERDGSVIASIDHRPGRSSLWFGDRTVDPDETYRYRVRPIDADGTPGEWSESVEATTSPRGPST